MTVDAWLAASGVPPVVAFPSDRHLLGPFVAMTGIQLPSGELLTTTSLIDASIREAYGAAEVPDAVMRITAIELELFAGDDVDAVDWVIAAGRLRLATVLRAKAGTRRYAYSVGSALGMPIEVPGNHYMGEGTEHVIPQRLRSSPYELPSPIEVEMRTDSLELDVPWSQLGLPASSEAGIAVHLHGAIWPTGAARDERIVGRSSGACTRGVSPDLALELRRATGQTLPANQRVSRRM